MKKQFTLEYIDFDGNTLARDYFATYDSAESFMGVTINSYLTSGSGRVGALRITDESGEELNYFEFLSCDEECEDEVLTATVIGNY